MATPLGDGEASGSGISATQLEALMASMRQGIKDEMVSLKRELSAEREASDEKLVKKLKLEKAPVFRKKGHEKQYLHNEEVRLKLSDVRSALTQEPPAVEKAKTLLEEGEKLITERQKHIRIADRSEHGWATVEEYLEDELADNSDDEKRLSRADNRAGKKLKSAKSGRGGRKPGPRKSPTPSSRSSVNVPGGAGNILNQPQWLSAAGLLPAAVAAAQSSLKWRVPGGGSTSGSNFGPCFECGMVNSASHVLT